MQEARHRMPGIEPFEADRRAFLRAFQSISSGATSPQQNCGIRVLVLRSLGADAMSMLISKWPCVICCLPVPSCCLEEGRIYLSLSCLPCRQLSCCHQDGIVHRPGSVRGVFLKYRI